MDTITYPPKDELKWEEDAEYPTIPLDIQTYANGAGYSPSKGHIIYGPGTFGIDPNKITTPERGAEMRRMRIEKKEQRIRDAIQSLTGKEMVDAFGEAGAQLWDEVVLNPDAPGRTRKDVWIEIGKQGGIVADRDLASEDKRGASLKIEGMTPDLAREIKELIMLARETE